MANSAVLSPTLQCWVPIKRSKQMSATHIDTLWSAFVYYASQANAECNPASSATHWHLLRENSVHMSALEGHLQLLHNDVCIPAPVLCTLTIRRVVQWRGHCFCWSLLLRLDFSEIVCSRQGYSPFCEVRHLGTEELVRFGDTTVIECVRSSERSIGTWRRDMSSSLRDLDGFGMRENGYSDTESFIVKMSWWYRCEAKSIIGIAWVRIRKCGPAEKGPLFEENSAYGQ